MSRIVNSMVGELAKIVPSRPSVVGEAHVDLQDRSASTSSSYDRLLSACLCMWVSAITSFACDASTSSAIRARTRAGPPTSKCALPPRRNACSAGP